METTPAGMAFVGASTGPPRHKGFASEEERVLGVWLYVQRISGRDRTMAPYRESQLNTVVTGWQEGRATNGGRRAGRKPYVQAGSTAMIACALEVKESAFDAPSLFRFECTSLMKRLAFVSTAPKGTLHHVELWVPDIDRAKQEWGWILPRLGYSTYQSWGSGVSWRLGPTYIVVEQSPALSGREHDRTAPGLNHLAFHAGSQKDVDALVVEGVSYGWRQLFQDKYPHAGCPDHYAAYLFNSDGFEIELVAAG
jgi:ribosome modulation factor